VNGPHLTKVLVSRINCLPGLGQIGKSWMVWERHDRLQAHRAVLADAKIAGQSDGGV
jgi:hypothetical protein